MSRRRDPRLEAELRRRAREEGFDAVAVASAERLDRHAEALAAWLRQDRHAAMAWMARSPERRVDPRHLLAGCRSVVALAMNYYPGPEASRVATGRAGVALYARGRDYHRVLGRKARRLADWLAETSGEATRACVDTSPVLERAWAEKSGLGWIGKNSCVLTRSVGSWILLAEILSAAELAPDPGPHADLCGTCTACLDACPTRAIVEPGIVDSNRCIAYWTIEHRGEFPEAVRPGIGEWIFGCDVCQEVCPWNRKSARAVSESRFALREDLQGIDPVEMLGLAETTFRARYSGTSLMRAKWQGMRRNACVVLGNRGDASALPALEQAAGEADPVVRSHATWAAERIRGVARGAQKCENEANIEGRASVNRCPGSG